MDPNGEFTKELQHPVMTISDSWDEESTVVLNLAPKLLEITGDRANEVYKKEIGKMIAEKLIACGYDDADVLRDIGILKSKY